MTYGDCVILDLQDLVDPQQFIVVPKCKTMDKISIAKRQRKVMTLCKEIELLDMSARSERVAHVGRHYRINESNVRKRESNIRSSVPAPQSAKVSYLPVQGGKICFGSRWLRIVLPLFYVGMQ